ncbi:MAG: hypothetical protein ACTHLU_08215, partial [Novosphingobium sp.]
ASLSVVAERVVFCEGTPEKSVDIAIYGAWFRAPKTAVVPVGGCDVVRRTFATFGDTSVVRNSNAIALVERDFWPDSYLLRLENEGLHVLPTHEVEGLLALRQIAAVMAAHLSIEDFSVRYSNFEANVRNRFSGIEFNKVVLERAKREVDSRLLGLPNAAYPRSDPADTRAAFVEVVDLARAIPDVGEIYDAHSAIVTAALAGGAEEMLRILPGKDLLSLLCGQFGVTPERYIEIAIEALAQPDSGGKESLELLRAGLVAALASHLPSREP